MAFAVTTPTPLALRRRRLAAPLSTAAVVGIAVIALHARDPHAHGAWGFCPFKALTGLDCPGCGGLRAVNDLTNGQFIAAVHSNALLLGLLPLAVVTWLVWFAQRWTSRPIAVPRSALRLVPVGLTVLAVGFGVVRNTPWGSSLYAS